MNPDVLVSFSILILLYCFDTYSLLKYDKIYGKIWSTTLTLTNKVIDPALSVGHYQVEPLKFMLVFVFMTHLSSYDNIFETQTCYFGGNMKVLMGHLYIC